ncbi:MAG: PEP-utilizing enzyme [Patescibacteria group bacterium]
MKIKNKKILKGTVVYLKKVSGRVYKIKNKRDLANFKKNYILVTSSLEPYMSTALSKAKAIICDKGGVFSHAAIVARELLIPCIVNTRKATKLLKNEDYIMIKKDGSIWLKLKN